MIDFIKRLLFGGTRRSLDAASGAGRMTSSGRIDSLNHDLLASTATIQARASYFARNNGHVVAAVNGLVANIVGPGVKPSSQHPDPVMRQRLHTLWRRWTDVADIDGVGDFYALQALMTRQMVEAGESFARFLVADAYSAADAPFRLQIIHPSQVPIDALASLTGRCHAGIEYDGQGRRDAYHVLPHRPNDPVSPLFSDLWAPVRVPASEMVHLFNPLEPGQLRGLSWLAPVLTAVHEVDQLQDAALVRAKLANLVCGAMVDPEGNAGGMPGSSSGGVLTAGMEPGTIITGKPGFGIEFFDPKESQNYAPFVKTHLQAIAAGIGVPYEILTGDLSQVNYSSIRAGLVEFRKRLEHWQHNILVFRLCRPVWDRFIRSSVLAGHIDLLAYESNPTAFHDVDWLPPRAAWVDPKKDAEAEVVAIRAGLMSRSQAVAARGYDVEAMDAAIAADRARERALGLAFDTTPVPDAAPDASTPDAEKADL